MVVSLVRIVLLSAGDSLESTGHRSSPIAIRNFVFNILFGLDDVHSDFFCWQRLVTTSTDSPTIQEEAIAVIVTINVTITVTFASVTIKTTFEKKCTLVPFPPCWAPSDMHFFEVILVSKTFHLVARLQRAISVRKHTRNSVNAVPTEEPLCPDLQHTLLALCCNEALCLYVAQALQCFLFLYDNSVS